jgi:hypothetical protein
MSTTIGEPDTITDVARHVEAAHTALGELLMAVVSGLEEAQANHRTVNYDNLRPDLGRKLREYGAMHAVAVADLLADVAEHGLDDEARLYITKLERLADDLSG